MAEFTEGLGDEQNVAAGSGSARTNKVYHEGCSDVDPWFPFRSRTEFKLANFLYRKVQMSQDNVDELMDYWAETLLKHDDEPPYADHNDLFSVINEIKHGDAPWHSFSATYGGNVPQQNAPSWMKKEYEVWYRDPRTVAHNILKNPAFKDSFDYVPLQEYDTSEKRRLQNLMSANWAWRQADRIVAEDPSTKGAMFVPIILGSDKTTVSVATGQNEYYPLYMSLGNLSNSTRRAHCESVIPIGFLAIPKGERKHDDSKDFRTFRRQLFHSSISAIFQQMKPYFSKPDVVVCPNGQYRRAIYGFGPYIADYPEQVLLAGVVQGWCPRCTAHRSNLDHDERATRRTQKHRILVQRFNPGVVWDEYGYVGNITPFTDDFPRADIHELLSPDLLHQLIKGTFKDHVVTWVLQYLTTKHGETKANSIIDDIDRRIAAVPLFPGLRRFPEGHRFKQWTGDDSKALMKVILPAIAGHVPPTMVRCVADLLEFTYLARHDVFDNDVLDRLDAALDSFHLNRTIFIEEGVRAEEISLPRQHSLKHYRMLIEEFGALNGLCSSITEAKHIRAVKQPWRRSSKYEPLGQILVTNQRQDKLAAAYDDFASRGMLHTTDLINIRVDPASLQSLDSGGEKSKSRGSDDSQHDEEAVDDIIAEVKLARTPAQGYPRYLEDLIDALDEPRLGEHIARFLFQNIYPNDPRLASDIPMHELPAVPNRLRVRIYHSAVSTFYAPSDLCGVNGMHRERIHAVPRWRNGAGRYDCVLIAKDDSPGFEGLHAARVRFFFDFWYNGRLHQCALVEWFVPVGEGPDPSTGMWIVKPDMIRSRRRPSVRATEVIHVDTILRGAHLIPVFGREMLPYEFHFSYSLDCFHSYYVNKFADHHMHEVAF
ncbi:hypothetical protein K474DRAFT_1682054 [Panus rudis PR-1116 ss-1]|nr:hypothetical protein K474DRAFT_1682054 [Panus rudis PR-1116 ss-1]